MRKRVTFLLILAFLVPVVVLAAGEKENNGKELAKELFSSKSEKMLLGGDFSLDILWDILSRVGLAALLGGAVAMHPLRLHRRKTIADPLKTGLAIRAQILICAAGALMVIVIGSSIARAFGLVGLGSFVRFRTTMKDPTDLAVMFLLVAIGMASGFGAWGVAVYGTLTIMCVIAVLELRHGTSTASAGTRAVTLTMKGSVNLFNKALGHIRQNTQTRVFSFSHKPKKERGTIKVFVPLDFEVESLLGELRSLGDFGEIGFEEEGE